MSVQQNTESLKQEDIVRLSYKVFLDEFKFAEEAGENVDELHERIYNSCRRDPDTRENIIGWPSNPWYREIGSMVFQWIETNRCPILDLPRYEHLEDNVYVEERNALIKETWNPMLARIKSLWESLSEDEKIDHLKEFYTCLGKRGQLDLLGLRKTTGGLDIWPRNAKGELLQAFESDHSTKEDQAAGVVAIEELGHENLSETWWGSCVEGGVVNEKLASALCAKVLDTATWISIKEAPTDYNEVEVRQENGYGMIWSEYGSTLKCVVEPEMLNGQVVGWKK